MKIKLFEEFVNEDNLDAALQALVPDLKSAFANYLENRDLVELMDELDALDSRARKIKGGSKEAGFWWRFFDDDTLANTAGGLKRDLELPPSHGNHKYAIENMELAIQPDTKMKVYFS